MICSPFAPGCSWVDFILVELDSIGLNVFQPIIGITGPIETGYKSRSLKLYGFLQKSLIFGELKYSISLGRWGEVLIIK